MKLYASLTGPLLGLYFPMPKELANEGQFRKALNMSKLKELWMSVYTEAAVDDAIEKYGGMKLPDSHARGLDFDYHKVMS